MPDHQSCVIGDPKRNAMTHSLSNENDVSTSALVLVVDDRTDICDMLYRALTLAGYRVATSGAGETWIEQAMQSDDSPALVLLDLSNPSIDAGSFLRDLRIRWKQAPPILVMTTDKHIYDKLAPMQRVVLKPFHVRDLLTEVQKIISGNSEGEHCST